MSTRTEFEISLDFYAISVGPNDYNRKTIGLELSHITSQETLFAIVSPAIAPCKWYNEVHAISLLLSKRSQGFTWYKQKQSLCLPEAPLLGYQGVY